MYTRASPLYNDVVSYNFHFAGEYVDKLAFKLQLAPGYSLVHEGCYMLCLQTICCCDACCLPKIL
jgi:hypothetical protein